jgi:hypothetical protein
MPVHHHDEHPPVLRVSLVAAAPEDPARRIRRFEVARHVSEGPAAASTLLGQTDERGILVRPARRFCEREAQREGHCEADGPDHERISIDTISPWSSV